MNYRTFADVFPLGSHLCREPMPAMPELKKDMENLKRHGFNLIKLQAQWAFNEPAEGRYDFSKYEELIAHAQKLDLGIYLGLTLEQAPMWLWEKHPDCRMVGRNGVPIAHQAQSNLPSDGKPGPCFDHAGAAADMDRFLRKTVEVLGRFENLVVWNTWQEIGYWGDVLVGQPICYCPNTIRHYQDWLKTRFGDLDALNRAWRSCYPEWRYVLPDRYGQRKNALAQNFWWDYFMANVQPAEILKRRAQVIKEADPLHRPVFAHKSIAQLASGMDWTYARCQDFLGCSAYPTTSGGAQGRHSSLFNEVFNHVVQRFDYIRSCNPRGVPVWAAEFQGGPVSSGLHLGRVPAAEDIRRWMLAAVGSGVTAISFWVTRVEIMAGELNGYGLLDSEGDSTERFEEAARVGRALNKHADLFGKPSWTASDVALLVNEQTYQFCQNMSQGGDHLQRSLTGWHRMLWDANIPVDFIETMELDEEYVQRYKAIIVPFPLSLSETVARRLVRYVERGGNLISEASPGRVDEYGFGTRGELSPTLRALFAVDQESFRMVWEPDDGKIWSPGERTWGEYLPATMLAGTGPLHGHSLRANVYIETFAPKDCTPVVMADDAVAGVCRKAGAGTAWLLGTYLGHNGNHYRDEETRRTVRALLKACGIDPIYNGALILRKRVNGRKEAWIFVNPTAQDVTETVAIPKGTTATDLLEDRIVSKDDRVTLTVKSVDVSVLIVTR